MAAAPAVARLDSMVETRERILRTARDVVSEEGWQGAQIALIAARAGVATGSVYRYFESKSVLFAHVLAAVSEHEITIINSHLDAEGSAAERLSNAIQSFVRRAFKSRRLAYALMAEPCEPEIDATRLKYRGEIACELRRVLREGIESGEFVNEDATVLASCITGAFVEAISGPLALRVKPDSSAVDRMAATIAGLCIRMVLANPGKPKRAPSRKAR
jgi:AcrR family transcriptional regulator